jgi:hypothetical protein
MRDKAQRGLVRLAAGDQRRQMLAFKRGLEQRDRHDGVIVHFLDLHDGKFFEVRLEQGFSDPSLVEVQDVSVSRESSESSVCHPGRWQAFVPGDTGRGE